MALDKGRCRVTPRVSILLPAHNEAAEIDEAIRCIRQQTFADWELLVLDDGSTDATPELVAAQAAADPRIRLVRFERQGLTRTLNNGLRIARGELIARQDADDRSLPERLERQVGFLDTHPEVGVVGSDWSEEGADGRRVRRRVEFVGGRLDDRLIDRNPLAHSSVVFRRSVVGGDGYDERYACAQDYDLWLRLRHRGVTLWNLDEPLLVRRMTGTSVGARRERRARYDELRMRGRDLLARTRGRDQVLRALVYAGRTLVSLALPIRLKRAVRERRGQTT